MASDSIHPALQRAADATQAVLACARQIRTAYQRGEPIDLMMLELRHLQVAADKANVTLQAAKKAGRVKATQGGWRLSLRMFQEWEQAQAIFADLVRDAEQKHASGEAQGEGR